MHHLRTSTLLPTTVSRKMNYFHLFNHTNIFHICPYIHQLYIPSLSLSHVYPCVSKNHPFLKNPLHILTYWLVLDDTVHLSHNARFPRSTKWCPCPLPGCPGSSSTWNGLRLHFSRRQWGNMIRILEEHLNLLPKCEHCGSQFPEGRLNPCQYA